MSGKNTSLTVFVMRHGERLDEALHVRGEDIPKKIKIDPPLTEQGHQQASEAFSRLLQGLRGDGKKRKIAVFSSPTQRTMGTSLMVSCASFGNGNNDDGLIEWGMQQPHLQTTDEKIESDSETRSSRAIPITVLNGLCSCTAFIARCGGGDAAVLMGYLPCADFPANDGSPTCPASVLLQTMQQKCKRAGLSQQHGDPIQYCKVQSGGWLVPLASPLTLQSTFQTPVPQFRTVPEYCQPKKDEQFWKALDRAVLLAEADGCDTLIVVAHREGVRELVDRWGANGFRLPRRLNYCCISGFKVKVFDDQSCQWFFHGVVDYQDFDVNFVSSKDRWRDAPLPLPRC